MFKNKTRLGNKFGFKDRIPKDLVSGVTYNFQSRPRVESCIGKYVRRLNARTEEQIGISPFIKKQLNPKNIYLFTILYPLMTLLGF